MPLKQLKNLNTGRGGAKVKAGKTWEEIHALTSLSVGGDGRVTYTAEYYHQALTRHGDSCEVTVHIWGGDPRCSQRWAVTAAGAELAAAVRKCRNAEDDIMTIRMTPAGLILTASVNGRTVRERLPAVADPGVGGSEPWQDTKCWISEAVYVDMVAAITARKLVEAEIWVEKIDEQYHVVGVADPAGGGNGSGPEPWRKVNTAGILAAWEALPLIRADHEHHSSFVQDGEGGVYLIRGHWLVGLSTRAGKGEDCQETAGDRQSQ